MTPSRFSRFPPSDVLTVDQRELIRSCLVAPSTSYITAEQRRAIRDICDQLDPIREPEHFLIAFKSEVVEAANLAGMLPGPERSSLLERLVSVFIAELYGRHVHPEEIRSNGVRERVASPESMLTSETSSRPSRS